MAMTSQQWKQNKIAPKTKLMHIFLDARPSRSTSNDILLFVYVTRIHTFLCLSFVGVLVKVVIEHFWLVLWNIDAAMRYMRPMGS